MNCVAKTHQLEPLPPPITEMGEQLIPQEVSAGTSMCSRDKSSSRMLLWPLFSTDWQQCIEPVLHWLGVFDGEVFLAPIKYVLECVKRWRNFILTRDGGAATGRSLGRKTTCQPLAVGVCADDDRCCDEGKDRCELHYAVCF